MAKYFFFEGTGGDGRLNYHSIKNDAVNEYFFSSTRKGQDHDGLMIRILDVSQDKFNIGGEKRLKLLENEAFTIYKKEFDGVDFSLFQEHIDFLNIHSFTIATEIIVVAKRQKFDSRIGHVLTTDGILLLKEEFLRIKYFGHVYFALFSALEGIWNIDTAYKLLFFQDLQTLLQDYQYPDDLVHHALFNYFSIDLSAFSKGIGDDFLTKAAPFPTIYADTQIEIFEVAIPSEFEIDGRQVGCSKPTKVGLLLNSKVGFNWWLFIPLPSASPNEALNAEIAQFIQSLAPDSKIDDVLQEYLANFASD